MHSDPRQRPYAIGCTTIYVAGCFAYAVLSLRLVFPQLYKAKKSLIDVDLIKYNPAIWALIMIASWGACPMLLTLLPWKQREYAGLPTPDAMNQIFAVKTVFKTALITLKTSLIYHLKATEDLVAFTVFFNLIVFTSAMIQRALTYSAVRAAKTKWMRVSVFLSYRVNPDQELVKQLCKHKSCLKHCSYHYS